MSTGHQSEGILGQFSASLTQQQPEELSTQDTLCTTYRKTLEIPPPPWSHNALHFEVATKRSPGMRPWDMNILESCLDEQQDHHIQSMSLKSADGRWFLHHLGPWAWPWLDQQDQCQRKQIEKLCSDSGLFIKMFVYPPMTRPLVISTIVRGAPMLLHLAQKVAAKEPSLKELQRILTSRWTHLPWTSRRVVWVDWCPY